MGGCQGSGGKGVRGGTTRFFAALRMTRGEEEGRFPNRPYGKTGMERHAAVGMVCGGWRE